MTDSGTNQINLREWQREALEAWNKSARCGVVEAVTGTGKTTLGISAAADALGRGLAVLVVVPGIDLLAQWHDAVRRALPAVRVGRRGGGQSDSFRNSDILISTIQSAIQSHAPTPNRPALLIADEVHRYGAASYSELLSDAFKERLGLTATFERTDDGVEQHLLPYFKNVIHGCGYERGHLDGILAPVRVMQVAIPFTPEEQEMYSEFDETAKAERRKLTQSYGCVEEPFGQFMHEVTLLSKGPGNPAVWSARRYLYAFSQRRAVLAECGGKLDTLREMGAVLAQGGRSIVFSESKEASRAAAAVLLEEGVQAAPYTSDLSKTDRAELLGLFKEGAVTALVAPKVLDEGIDVPEADVGVILAGSKSRRQMIQRMGRIIRPKSDGRHASFVLLYARGSSEDPANGAHGTFLEQLTGIADEIVTVDHSEAAATLAGWLGGETRDGKEGLVGTANSSPTQTARIIPRLYESDEGELVVLKTIAASKIADHRDILLACLSILNTQQLFLMINRLGLAGGAPLPILAVADTMGLVLSEAAQIQADSLARLSEPGTARVFESLIDPVV